MYKQYITIYLIKGHTLIFDHVFSSHVKLKMVYSSYEKERILHLYSKGLKAPTVKKQLASEGLTVSREGVHKFIAKFREISCMLRRQGSGRPLKVTAEIKKIVDDQMRSDN